MWHHQENHCATQIVVPRPNSMYGGTARYDGMIHYLTKVIFQIYPLSR
jgi:hypothetical protein